MGVYENGYRKYKICGIMNKIKFNGQTLVLIIYWYIIYELEIMAIYNVSRITFLSHNSYYIDESDCSISSSPIMSKQIG